MIKDLMSTEGPVNEIFLVKQATRATSSNGTPYLSLTLQDASGTVDGKMWQIEDADVQLAQPGALILVRGQVSMYKGHPQVKINTMDPVDEKSVDMAKFIPVAPRPLEEMEKELWADVDQIQDAQLKTLTASLLKEHYDDYVTYPAGVSIHHAYLGGLMYHSLSICALAIQVADHYPFLNKDYLISGSLLHDIGKIQELSGPKASVYTDEGNLLGHITLGAMLVYSEGKKLGTDPEKLDVLTHMILAHHGKPEYGSAKVPMTPEAYVLHSLDDLDAHLEILKNAYALTEDGKFTGKIGAMENGNFFKPHTFEELSDLAKKED